MKDKPPMVTPECCRCGRILHDAEDVEAWRETGYCAECKPLMKMPIPKDKNEL